MRTFREQEDFTRLMCPRRRSSPCFAKGIEGRTRHVCPKLGKANALDVKTCRLILAELEAIVQCHAVPVRVLRGQGSQ